MRGLIANLARMHDSGPSFGSLCDSRAWAGRWVVVTGRGHTTVGCITGRKEMGCDLRSLMRQFLIGTLSVCTISGCSSVVPSDRPAAFLVGSGVYVKSIAVSSMPRLAPNNSMHAQLTPNLGSHIGSARTFNPAGAGG